MEVKICIKCGETKGLECFNTAKQNKDGLRGECKTCQAEYKKQYRKDNAERIATSRKQYYKDNTEKLAEYKKQYYEKNAEKIVAKNKKWSETHPEKMAEYKKQWIEANPEKKAESQKKWNGANSKKLAESKKRWIEANSEYYKQYYKYNTEKITEINKKWSDANPEKCRLINQRRRAMKKSLLSDFTVEQWEACLLYFDYKDAYTGLPLSSPSQDHVIPLSKGGCYTVDNIVPCERNINSSKGNRDMLTWFRKQVYYDVEREKKILAYLKEVPSGFNARKRQGVKSNEFSRFI